MPRLMAKVKYTMMERKYIGSTRHITIDGKKSQCLSCMWADKGIGCPGACPISMANRFAHGQLITWSMKFNAFVEDCEEYATTEDVTAKENDVHRCEG